MTASSQGNGRPPPSPAGAPRRGGGGGLERLVAAERDEEWLSSEGAIINGGGRVIAGDRTGGSQGVPGMTASFGNTMEGQSGRRQRTAGVGSATATLKPAGGAGAKDARCACHHVPTSHRSRTSNVMLHHVPVVNVKMPVLLCVRSLFLMVTMPPYICT